MDLLSVGSRKLLLFVVVVAAIRTECLVQTIVCTFLYFDVYYFFQFFISPLYSFCFVNNYQKVLLNIFLSKIRSRSVSRCTSVHASHQQVVNSLNHRHENYELPLFVNISCKILCVSSCLRFYISSLLYVMVSYVIHRFNSEVAATLSAFSPSR